MKEWVALTVDDACLPGSGRGGDGVRRATLTRPTDAAKRLNEVTRLG